MQKPEYRPCIVTEDRSGRTIDGTIVKDILEYKALFHCWIERYKYFNNNVYAGAYTQPSHIIQTMAIVESEGGSVHEVMPEQIKFMDGKAKEYDFKDS